MALQEVFGDHRTEQVLDDYCVADARAALDDHLTQRGDIAHRAATTSVTKRQVSDFYQLVTDLTKSMDAYLGVFVLDATGTDPFVVATGPF